MCNGYIIADYSYLSHHGILGQKWGKMNGPPYPLGSGDHSKAEKKAGWRKSLGPGRNEELYGRKNNAKVQNGSKKTNKKTEPKSEHKGLTNGQKTAIKVAGVAIAAVGVVYLYKSGKLDGVIDVGKSKIGKLLGDVGSTPITETSSHIVPPSAPKIKAARITDFAKNLSEKTGFKLKTEGMSKVADAAAINPNYEKTRWASEENCGYASMGWCLRRLGLDIKIKDSFEGNAFRTNDITDFFSKAKFPHAISQRGELDSSSVKSIKKSLTEQIMNFYHPTNGHVGMIGCMKGRASNGHFMAWEMNNGIIEFIDAQSGGTVSIDNFFKHVVSGAYAKDDIAFTDLTNAIPKPEVLKEIFDSR